MVNNEFKVLLLAPHPFYVVRGTPIDVELVLRVLSERENTSVDVVTYHLGEDIDHPEVKLYRIPELKFIKNIRPGFSIKKLICDSFLFFKAGDLLRKNKYNLIHAGEETVFFAMFFKMIYKIPYAYDIDSSIAQQLVEKKPYLKIFSRFFNWLEAKAIQGSIVNLPVCNALADLCEEKGSQKTVTLHDISQLQFSNTSGKYHIRTKEDEDKLILLYVGNLEPYQGIDLLLDSFKIVAEKTEKINLVIIGGAKEDINFYSKKATRLGIDKRVRLIGKKPFRKLNEYLSEADIIACPRIRGINTPMKIFPSLHSGKAVIATDLYTHNQILTNKEAFLAPDDPEGFAEGILKLIEDKNLRNELGTNGKIFVEKNHTYKAHKMRLNGVYDWIQKRVLKLKTHENFL